ncbi:helix-turn-helix domain-containing protein [Streptomyces catenulae]|uniref:Helix-turn-helix domain-containing protein n=1 Tax=Streptomyces catenulae TaxID=66875 RepID=A0ABV2Z2E5_9ACTN
MAVQFMDVKQTAEFLSVSVQWLYREAPRTGLASYKFGVGRNAKIRFKRSEVEVWVRQQRISKT